MAKKQSGNQDIEYQGNDAQWKPIRYADPDLGETNACPTDSWANGRGVETFAMRRVRGRATRMVPSGRRLMIPQPNGSMVYNAQGGRPQPGDDEDGD